MAARPPLAVDALAGDDQAPDVAYVWHKLLPELAPGGNRKPPRGRLTARLDRVIGLLEQLVEQRELAHVPTREADAADEPDTASDEVAAWRARAFELLAINSHHLVSDLAEKIAADRDLNPRRLRPDTIRRALGGVRAEFCYKLGTPKSPKSPTGEAAIRVDDDRRHDQPEDPNAPR